MGKVGRKRPRNKTRTKDAPEVPASPAPKTGWHEDLNSDGECWYSPDGQVRYAMTRLGILQMSPREWRADKERIARRELARWQMEQDPQDIQTEDPRHMNGLRIFMEVVRTTAAAVAATILLFHAPYTDAQSRMPGPHSFSEKTVSTLMDIHFNGFLEACRMMKMQCRDIAPPRVAYAVLPYQYGAFDIGSRTVLLDIRIFSQEISLAIIVHESIHYLQDKRSPLRTSVTLAESCKDEKEAHELTMEWTRETGIAKDDARVKDWSSASSWYGCPAP
jgi:hypothetical protein